MSTGNDKRFFLLSRTLLGLGFVRYPSENDRRITYRHGEETSTLDYFFVRGVKINEFEVGRFFLTQHRPLHLVFEVENLSSSDFEMSHALGKAYIRSPTAFVKLIEAFDDLPLLSSGLEVRIFLCTK